MLLRLAYLTVTNAFAVLRLLPMSNRDKDAEILALRHQISILQRQLGPEKAKFTPQDQAFLAALLQPLSREVLRRLRLIVRPDTVLRWHRDLMSQRHAKTHPGPSGPAVRAPCAPSACLSCAWSGRIRPGGVRADNRCHRC